MVVHFVNAFKGIMADNIGMTIVMDNHVHLCNTSNFIIDFYSIKMLCCKVVPIIEVINSTLLIIIACLISHIIKRMQKETTRTTGRIKDIPILFGFHHFYTKLNNRTRSKVLPEIALKKTIHKLFESNAFNIEVCFVKVNCLQM